MRDNLDVIKKKHENLTIRAPVAGQLTALTAEVGQLKTSGERLGQIDILGGFKINATVDEYYINRVELGGHGVFEFDGNTYDVAVQKIYPEVADGRFEVDLSFLGESPSGIRRGQTLRVRLELGEMSEAVLLPRGGFFQATGGSWVYVVDGSGEFARKRRIHLGRQNPDVFEVLEGLEVGERVITSSYEGFGTTDRLVLE
jgi:HlyD family secretion protein